MLLLIAIGIGLLLGLILFLPSRGYYWRWRHLSDRVHVEDALKHLYKAEYGNRPVTLDSLAGGLHISSDRAATVMDRLEAARLTVRQADAVKLSSEGREYALRVIRTHRLWERYLSDETGISEPEWHGSAEHMEHHLSETEVDALSAQLGEPRFDPHGDPIPTAQGDLPPRIGQPLGGLETGDTGRIVHLEDEPQSVYERLIAEGLHLNMRVRVIEVTPLEVRFWADGEPRVLPPVAAANVYLNLQAETHDPTEPIRTLSDLRPGQTGRVYKLATACRGMERRRLMDLGILPETQITYEMRSPSGDPTAYLIRGAVIGLRKKQTDQILIESESES